MVSSSGSVPSSAIAYMVSIKSGAGVPGLTFPSGRCWLSKLQKDEAALESGFLLNREPRFFFIPLEEDVGELEDHWLWRLSYLDIDFS